MVNFYKWIKNFIALPQLASYTETANSLRREIKEEAGIEVGDLSYLCDMTFIRPDNIPVVILSFYASYKSGDIKLDEDSINYTWSTYEEAKKYDLVEGLIDEIKMVEELLKSS